MILATENSTIWDANLYLKFADARMRPALDLIGRLDPATGARPGHAIYDLGCGAGNISRILAERFAQAPVIGIDSSEEMLAKARSQTTDRRVTFAKGDLTQLQARHAAIDPLQQRRLSMGRGATSICSPAC